MLPCSHSHKYHTVCRSVDEWQVTPRQVKLISLWSEGHLNRADRSVSNFLTFNNRRQQFEEAHLIRSTSQIRKHSWGGPKTDYNFAWIALIPIQFIFERRTTIFQGHLSESWWPIWFSFLFQVWSLPQKSGLAMDNKGRWQKWFIRRPDIRHFPLSSL